MQDLKERVEAIQAGDPGPFEEIVRAFQDMAVGYAFSILNDFHLAEDVAQEAFITAYLQIQKLQTPEAFPGWFKRIVFTQCNRITRRKKWTVSGLPPESLESSSRRGPAEEFEGRVLEANLSVAIDQLPEDQRSALLLSYIGEFSQGRIASFLELPVTTVNSRLHRARIRLKEELDNMAKERLSEFRPSRDSVFVTDVGQMVAAIDAIDTGDIPKLKQHIASSPALIHAKATEDLGRNWYREGTYFAGATLLQHVAGNPIRKPMPDNCVEVARTLIEAGASKEAIQETLELVGSGRQPFEAGYWKPLINLLLESGADMNYDNTSVLFATLFHTVECKGQLEVGKYLRSLGANVDLAFAAALGEVATVESFFKEDGMLTKDAYSCHRHNGHCLIDPTQQEIIDEAFVWASFNNQPETADLLLEKGADINVRPLIGGLGRSTALHRTCLGGWTEMAGWLLDHGADPDIKDENWKSRPVTWAVHGGHLDTVLYLIDRGVAEIAVALDSAEFAKKGDIISALKERANQ